ncbi:hypothetical protein DRO97_06590 [Archaeoglobales archaeon]|nr:MAG: hypothetical protein DRO97_06590 [Archaeoglobales archaeon]
MNGEKVIDDILELSSDLLDAVSFSLFLVISNPNHQKYVDANIMAELVSNLIDSMKKLKSNQTFNIKIHNLIEFIDYSVEILITVKECAEEIGISLPPYLNLLIDKATKLFEELPPHLQHHRYNTQKRNKTNNQKIYIEIPIHQISLRR